MRDEEQTNAKVGRASMGRATIRRRRTPFCSRSRPRNPLCSPWHLQQKDRISFHFKFLDKGSQAGLTAGLVIQVVEQLREHDDDFSDDQWSKVGGQTKIGQWRFVSLTNGAGWSPSKDSTLPHPTQVTHKPADHPNPTKPSATRPHLPSPRGRRPT